MKTIGIIGGTGPETTVEYYRRIIAGCRQRDPEHRGAPIVINSIDNKRLVDWFTANQLASIADLLVTEIERLKGAGADFGLIAAITPHIVFGDVQKRSPLPLLSIVDSVRDAVVASGVRRPALFGTRFTMQSQLFPDALNPRGVTIVVPDADEQAFIHDKYMNELFIGVIRDDTRAALLGIAEKMKTRNNIDALILGGTELSLTLRESTAAGLPVFDATQIHVDAAVARMFA